jgi:hypothetical protein
VVGLVVAIVALACSLVPGRHAPGPRPCAPEALRGTTSVQGATGSLMGWFDVVNRGRMACRLEGPVRIVRVDSNRRQLPLLGLDLPTRPQEFLLRPGQHVGAGLRLSNACTPGVLIAGELYATFDRGRARVDLHEGPGGRCDEPGRPPSYSMGKLVRLSAR